MKRKDGTIDSRSGFIGNRGGRRNVLVGCKVPLHMSGKKEELRFSTIGENLVPPGADPVADDKLLFLLAPGSPGRKLGSTGTRTARNDGRLERRPGGSVFDSETDMRRSNAKP